jgi:hypothetical protein
VEVLSANQVDIPETSAHYAFMNQKDLHQAQLPLRKVDKDFFAEHGFLYIKKLYPESIFKSLLEEISKVIALIGEREGCSVVSFDSKEFDRGLKELLQKDRKLGGLIYEVVKKLPAHIQLASHPVHNEVCKMLMNMRFPGFAARGWGLRMDHPSEDTFLTQLHQDYVSQLGSSRGLVFWTPLRFVDALLGPLVIFPGSHKQGVFPINVRGKGSEGLQIADEPSVRAQFKSICPEVADGDTVVMDYMTLHESSPNRSTNTRWSLISRYFEFQDPVGRKIGWAGGIQEGSSFEELFPELVKN